MSRSHLDGVIPRHQIGDLALFVTANDCFERAGKPSVWIDPVHLAGFDQRRNDAPVIGPSVMASEEGVLSVQGYRSDCALDGVVVDRDAAIC